MNERFEPLSLGEYLELNRMEVELEQTKGELAYVARYAAVNRFRNRLGMWDRL